MTNLLNRAGGSFLRAFGLAFLFFATGILSAPNLSAAVALSVAAVCASLAAGLKAIMVLVPSLTFARLLPQPYAAWVDSFARAAVGTFLVAVTGWLAAPDLATWRSAAIAALVGAGAAGARALQGIFTQGEQPTIG